MAEQLLPFGYDVFTVDIQWYEPGATGYDISRRRRAGDGRARAGCIPAPNRFPSAAGGAGFKPLADYVHGLGLKFGIHLMRGIPRLAVERNLPVLGTPHRCGDIADRKHLPLEPGHVRRRHDEARRAGVLRLRLRADRVLGRRLRQGGRHQPALSPQPARDRGDAPRDRPHRPADGAEPVARRDRRSLRPSTSPTHANMWRISDDFWDEWPLLVAQFGRLAHWTPHRRPGAWPDADMLPLGLLALGERRTRFTPDEQRTLMTLWAIARSPLIMGGDLRALDARDAGAAHQRRVIAVNQPSTDNRPLDRDDGTSRGRRAAAERSLSRAVQPRQGTEEVGFALAALGVARGR